MMVRCVFGGLYPRSGLARPSQGRCPGVSQPVEIRAPLIPPRFSDRRTLAVASFIYHHRTELVWKRKTSHTSATNSDTAGPTSEVATAIPDSAGQQKPQRFPLEEEAFSGNTDKGVGSSGLMGVRFLVFLHTFRTSECLLGCAWCVACGETVRLFC